MSRMTPSRKKNPLAWFCHEFGLFSIHDTGRNAYLIILARSCRMFAYGTNSLILAIFFSALSYTDHTIGVFMTLTLLGDVLLGTFLTLVADRVGRRRVLLAGSVLMVVSGAVFALFENFWILLAAAVLGVISVTGGDFGPFRSIEESVLSQLTTPSTRADVLAWYVTTSTLGSSIGSEVSGRVVHYLQGRDGWTEVDAYHALFWIYAVMGIVNALLVLPLTDACELQASPTLDEDYARVPEEDDDEEAQATSPEHGNGIALPDVEAAPAAAEPPSAQPSSRSWTSKTRTWLTQNLSQISASTRAIMYKLWLLLALDSLADGMVPYSLTNYYMDEKFHPSKSTLGDVTSVSYFVGAIGAVFAGPLARHIGLINTMVFTHVPSSAAVLVFAWPSHFWLTAALLLLRTGLNNMDQAPRSAFIAAVVHPNERTSAMGITSMLRTLAAMAGPTVTGFLAGNDRFGVAFVVAGVCRLAYDFGLYAMFVNMKLHQHEAGPGHEEGGRRTSLPTTDPNSRRAREERLAAAVQGDDEFLELESLADSESSGSDEFDDKRRKRDKTLTSAQSTIDRNDDITRATMPQEETMVGSGNSAALQPPGGSETVERVRSRSPHRSTALD